MLKPPSGMPSQLQLPLPATAKIEQLYVSTAQQDQPLKDAQQDQSPVTVIKRSHNQPHAQQVPPQTEVK